MIVPIASAVIALVALIAAIGEAGDGRRAPSKQDLKRPEENTAHLTTINRTATQQRDRDALIANDWSKSVSV